MTYYNWPSANTSSFMCVASCLLVLLRDSDSLPHHSASPMCLDPAAMASIVHQAHMTVARMILLP